MFLEDGFLKTETNADPFSLENLTTWLEKQPASKEYNFFDQCGCALHQYFSDLGHENVWVGGTTVILDNGPRVPIPRHFRDIARGDSSVPGDRRWTFGEALKRAREIAI